MDILGDLVGQLKGTALKTQGRVDDSLKQLESVNNRTDMAQDEMTLTNAKLSSLEKKK